MCKPDLSNCLQAGTPCTPEKTADQIYEALRLSTLSDAADKIKTHKTSTGVSDSTCVKALQAIVDLGKTMYGGTHPASSSLTKEEVQAKLVEEMERVIETHGINPLIGMPGMCLRQSPNNSLIESQV